MNVTSLELYEPVICPLLCCYSLHPSSSMTYFVNYAQGGGEKKTNMKITLEPLNSRGSMGDGGDELNTS